MKRSRFTEEQIIVILKEQEAGQRTADVWRGRSVREATFYKWKAKFGGLEVSEANRLKDSPYEWSILGSQVTSLRADITT